MRVFLLVAAVLSFVPLTSAQGREKPDTKSKEPPRGAPWTKDFGEAHRRARKSGRPIFVYSTKTY